MPASARTGHGDLPKTPPLAQARTGGVGGSQSLNGVPTHEACGMEAVLRSAPNHGSLINL